MSDELPRIDLRFGDMAVSVQGVEQPVQAMKQILRFVQRLVEETPEITSTGFQLDEETANALIADVAARTGAAAQDIAATPGLIVLPATAAAAEEAPEPATAPPLSA